MDEGILIPIFKNKCDIQNCTNWKIEVKLGKYAILQSHAVSILFWGP
jgi:hypothetical protein